VTDVLLLSPHFDDVPLSLGQSLTDGRLAGARVTVAVAFSRSNWTRWFHPTRRRAGAVSALRRAEEAVGARRFGYRVVTLGAEEWMLRTGRTDLAGLLDPDADVHADGLDDLLLQRLDPLLDGADAVWTCAGVGNHVDHQVVREIGARLVDSGRSGVAFYLDRPYAALADASELEDVGHRLAGRLGVPLELVDVSGPIAPGLGRRLRRTYPSQIDDLFRSAMDADVATGAVEQVWVPRGEDREGTLLAGR
jgi:LmbE family N-acetylglucosaminyl deacetylase